MRRTLVPLLLLLGVGFGAAARAQAPAPATDEPASAEPSPAAPAEDAEPQESEVAPDSPRASLEAYLLEGRAGEWAKAARYLALPEERRSEGPVLAEHLKAVLDKYVWFDLERISPESGGDRKDGLSAGVEKVGEIPVGSRTQPVYMVRRSDDAGPYWAFSPNTVRRIDGWYDQLGDRWIRDRLPEALLLPGPFGIVLRWQWLALPLLLLGAWALGRLLGGVTSAVLGRLLARTENTWDDRLLRRIGPPLTFAWGLAAFSVGLSSLSLTARAEDLFREAVHAGVIVVVFWALWRSVDVLVDILLGSPWAAVSPSARNLLQIGSNISKGVVAGVGALAVLSAFGYPVTTLLAGLGIGGLAFAFGAQKTVENLFGSISLAVDQPFRVGDFVKVEDFVGTVEEIGIRSTRFRTLDRTVISIPNGILSNQRLETFAARDRMRLATIIGVEYSTTHEQMQQVLEGFERVLREHPKIWPDAMVVKFKEFGASSLDIEIMAWFQVPTWGDFQLCRQEVLLGFMKVVEEAGTGFAFPTRTLHVFNEDRPQPREDPGPAAGRPPSDAPPPGTSRPGDLPTAD
ncbi:MAG: mechanosensitive ion channel family protein [Acidobacteria bacterium]|jgi:MscS family membrane protein|nr:mechanosensitive ion channel family protein [Acidobacteriota bacterium]